MSSASFIIALSIVGVLFGFRSAEYEKHIEKATSSLTACKLENAAMERQIIILNQIIGLENDD